MTERPETACPDCDAEPIRSDGSLFNVVYVCPECGRQLACESAKE